MWKWIIRTLIRLVIKIHAFNFIFRQRNYQSQFFIDCVIETIIWTEDQDTYLVLKGRS